MELSPVVDALIKEFEMPQPSSREGVHPTVSRTVSILAVLYEKARNAVEFRAEHLVRRAAIERILKRRILLNGSANTVAENLVTELLWARYIDSSVIDEQKIADIQAMIDRYLALKRSTPESGTTPEGVSWDAILGLASAEIEETIVSGRKRDALNHFFYQAIRTKIRIPGANEQYVNIQTYISIERAFAQADEALISYHLLRIMQPDWFTTTSSGVAAASPTFFQNMHTISAHLSDPVAEPLARYIRKHTPPFLLLRDFFMATDKDARAVISDQLQFEQKLAELATERYQEIGSKVRRAVIRSFIYIFLTKMIFALALEAPYDLYISKRISYLPLTVNALFPPLFMVLVAGFIGVPGGENTQRLIARVKKIIYNFGSLAEETDVFTPKQRVRRPVLITFFSLLYLVGFGVTFGLIHLILTWLHFNVVSQVIFVFFIALITFFAYRIRQSAKEYEVIEHQGFLEPIMDFFLLPIVRAGHILSREITRLNVFIFLFDFILEAPLKVIFEVVEEWIRFVRTKKEEIV